MSIVVAPNTYFDIQIKPDFVADTMAEVLSVVDAYSGKYIQITDQNSAIFYVYLNNGVNTLVDAVDSANYQTVIASSGGGGGGPSNLYVQSATPTAATGTSYLWLQTNYMTPDGFTLWFDDGT